MIDNCFESLYRQRTGKRCGSPERLPGSGSNRRYYRVGTAPALIGTYGEDIAENRAFIYLCNHFSQKGLPVPKVAAVSEDCRCYLQADLGRESLFDFISSGRQNGEWTDEIVGMLEDVIALLPEFQWRGAEGLDFRRCYPVAAMDRRTVMWDLNYFKYCFLKVSGVEFDEAALEDDFNRLADDLLRDSDTPTFMYRDFQSRNVMVKDGQPWFIDFQGGRRGPYHYDVASFLWQAKAHYPAWLRERLIDTYIKSASRYCGLDSGAFRRELRLFVLFRLMQVLGAYGFRGYSERKPHFLQSIPPAIDNLRELLAGGGFDNYPALVEVLERMVAVSRFNRQPSDGVLTVRVSSFGYNKHGVPVDDTGNGGGYVFDCRALHNPGRYAEYKSLTGRDRAVVEFLENDGGILRFLNNVYELVDDSVAAYLERGFTDLSVNFGCTGGQHRSLYSADRTVEHLRGKFPGIRIVLTHFEQGIKEIFEPEK